MAISYAKVVKNQARMGKREKTSPIQRPKDSKKRKKNYSGKKKTTTSR